MKLSDLTTRCGYKFDISYTNGNTFYGYIYIKFNGKIIEIPHRWDSTGNSIDKDLYPTRYYYDLIPKKCKKKSR